MPEVTGGSLDEIQRKLKEIARIDREDEEAENLGADISALAALSPSWILCGLSVPAPCLGSLMLLQMVDSVFLHSDNREIKIKDIVEVLFLLCKKKDALKFFIKPKSREDFLNRAQKIAEKDSKFFDVFLKSDLGKFGDYESALSDFAFTLPAFDITGAAGEIMRYLTLCVEGFNSDESANDADAEKKNARNKTPLEARVLPFKRDESQP